MEFDDVGFDNGAPLRGLEDVTRDQPLEHPGTKFQQRKPTTSQSLSPADAAPRRVSGASVDDDVRALAFDAFFASEFGQVLSEYASDRDGFREFAAEFLTNGGASSLDDPAVLARIDELGAILRAAGDGDFSDLPDIAGVDQDDGFAAYSDEMSTILLAENILALLAIEDLAILEQAIAREIGHWMSHQVNGDADQVAGNGAALDEGDSVFQALGGKVADDEIHSTDHETVYLALDGGPTVRTTVERAQVQSVSGGTEEVDAISHGYVAQLTDSADHSANIGHNESQIFNDGWRYYYGGHKSWLTHKDKDVHLNFSTQSSAFTGQSGNVLFKFDDGATIHFTEARQKTPNLPKKRYEERAASADAHLATNAYSWGGDLSAADRAFLETHFELNAQTGTVTQKTHIDFADPKFHDIELSIDVQLSKGAKGNVRHTLNKGGALPLLSGSDTAYGGMSGYQYRDDNFVRANAAANDVSGNWGAQDSMLLGVELDVTATTTPPAGFGYDTGDEKEVSLSLHLRGDNSIEDESGGDHLGQLFLYYDNDNRQQDSDVVDNQSFSLERVWATGEDENGDIITVELTSEFEITDDNVLKLKEGRWLELSEGKGLSGFSLQVDVKANGTAGNRDYIDSNIGPGWQNYLANGGHDSIRNVGFDLEPTTFSFHINPTPEQRVELHTEANEIQREIGETSRGVGGNLSGGGRGLFGVQTERVRVGRRFETRQTTRNTRNEKLYLTAEGTLVTGDQGSEVVRFSDAKVTYQEKGLKGKGNYVWKDHGPENVNLAANAFSWGSDLSAGERQFLEDNFTLNAATGTVTQKTDIDLSDATFNNLELSIDVRVEHGGTANVKVTLNAGAIDIEGDKNEGYERLTPGEITDNTTSAYEQSNTSLILEGPEGQFTAERTGGAVIIGEGENAVTLTHDILLDFQTNLWLEMNNIASDKDALVNEYGYDPKYADDIYDTFLAYQLAQVAPGFVDPEAAGVMSLRDAFLPKNENEPGGYDTKAEEAYRKMMLDVNARAIEKTFGVTADPKDLANDLVDSFNEGVIGQNIKAALDAEVRDGKFEEGDEDYKAFEAELIGEVVALVQSFDKDTGAEFASFVAFDQTVGAVSDTAGVYDQTFAAFDLANEESQAMAGDALATAMLMHDLVNGGDTLANVLAATLQEQGIDLSDDQAVSDWLSGASGDQNKRLVIRQTLGAFFGDNQAAMDALAGVDLSGISTWSDLRSAVYDVTGDFLADTASREPEKVAAFVNDGIWGDGESGAGLDTSLGLYSALGASGWKAGFEGSDIGVSLAELTATMALLDEVAGEGALEGVLAGDAEATTALTSGLAFISRFSLVENGYAQANDVLGATGWYDLAEDFNPDLMAGYDANGVAVLDATGNTALYLDSFGLDADIIGAWQSGTLSLETATLIAAAIDADGFEVGQSVTNENGETVVITQEILALYNSAEAGGTGRGTQRLTGLEYNDVLGLDHGFLDTGLTLDQEQAARDAFVAQDNGYDAADNLIVTRDDDGFAVLSHSERTGVLRAIAEKGGTVGVGDVIEFEDVTYSTGTVSQDEAATVFEYLSTNPAATAGDEINADGREIVLSEDHIAVYHEADGDEQSFLDLADQLITRYANRKIRQVVLTGKMVQQHSGYVDRAPGDPAAGAAPANSANQPAKASGKLEVRPPLTPEEQSYLDNLQKNADGVFEVNASDLTPKGSSGLYDLQNFQAGTYEITELSHDNGKPSITKVTVEDFNGTKRITSVEYVTGFEGTNNWTESRKDRGVDQGPWRANNDIASVQGRDPKTNANIYVSLDDAGHLRRDKFGGGVHAFNLVAQDQFTNQNEWTYGEVREDGTREGATWRNWEQEVEKFLKNNQDVDLNIRIELEYDIDGELISRPDRMNLDVTLADPATTLSADADASLKNLQGYKTIENELLSEGTFKKVKGTLRVNDAAGNDIRNGGYETKGGKKLNIEFSPSDRVVGANVTPQAHFFNRDAEDIAGWQNKLFAMLDPDTTDFASALDKPVISGQAPEIDLMLTAKGDYFFRVNANSNLDFADLPPQLKEFVSETGIPVVFNNVILAPSPQTSSDLAVSYKPTSGQAREFLDNGVTVEQFKTALGGNPSAEEFSKFRNAYSRMNPAQQAYWVGEMRKGPLDLDLGGKGTDISTAMRKAYNTSLGLTPKHSSSLNALMAELQGAGLEGFEVEFIDKASETYVKDGKLYLSVPDLESGQLSRETVKEITYHLFRHKAGPDRDAVLAGSNTAEEFADEMGRLDFEARRNAASFAQSGGLNAYGLQRNDFLATNIDSIGIFRLQTQTANEYNENLKVFNTSPRAAELTNIAEKTSYDAFDLMSQLHDEGYTVALVQVDGKDRIGFYQKNGKKGSASQNQIRKIQEKYGHLDVDFLFGNEATQLIKENEPVVTSKQLTLQNLMGGGTGGRARSAGAVPFDTSAGSRSTWNLFRESVGADDFLEARAKLTQAFSANPAQAVNGPPRSGQTPGVRFQSAVEGIGAGSRGIGKVLGSAVPLVDIAFAAWGAADAFQNGDRTDKALAIADIATIALDVAAVGLATLGAGAAAGSGWALAAAAAGPIGVAALGITAAVIIISLIKSSKEAKEIREQSRPLVQFLLGDNELGVNLLKDANNVEFRSGLEWQGKAYISPANNKLIFGENSEDALVELFADALADPDAGGSWLVNLFHVFDMPTG